MRVAITNHNQLRQHWWCADKESFSQILEMPALPAHVKSEPSEWVGEHGMALGLQQDTEGHLVTWGPPWADYELVALVMCTNESLIQLHTTHHNPKRDLKKFQLRGHETGSDNTPSPATPVSVSDFWNHYPGSISFPNSSRPEMDLWIYKVLRFSSVKCKRFQYPV